MNYKILKIEERLKNELIIRNEYRKILEAITTERSGIDNLDNIARFENFQDLESFRSKMLAKTSNYRVEKDMGYVTNILVSYFKHCQNTTEIFNLMTNTDEFPDVRKMEYLYYLQTDVENRITECEHRILIYQEFCDTEIEKIDTVSLPTKEDIIKGVFDPPDYNFV
jgi:hypothetical protein